MSALNHGGGVVVAIADTSKEAKLRDQDMAVRSVAVGKEGQAGNSERVGRVVQRWFGWLVGTKSRDEREMPMQK